MCRLCERYRLPELTVANYCGAGLSETVGLLACGTKSVGTDHTRFHGQESREETANNTETANSSEDVHVLELLCSADDSVDHFLLERYTKQRGGWTSHPLLRDFYYTLRPFMPFGMRRYLQRVCLGDWSTLSFPLWPIDCSVERVLEQQLILTMRAIGVDSLPFIWFWPEGRQACAIITHDVEESTGRDFCPRLMDIDDAHGIKASFQLVPEGPYAVSAAFIEEIRRRGFEVNVHDLNHDGRLFRSNADFLRRIDTVNRYGRAYGTAGFRSGSLYRNLDWFQLLRFEFDMSVPNVGHIEPQRGGCCTVFPYFVGEVLELPLTTTQDYALFNHLKQNTTDLWRKQIEVILSEHGLISILVHPDYLLSAQAQSIYTDLLRHICQLRDQSGLWITTPAQLNRWWRQRNAMTLESEQGKWRVRGDGCERARVMFAHLDGDKVAYVAQE